MKSRARSTCVLAVCLAASAVGPGAGPALAQRSGIEVRRALDDEAIAAALDPANPLEKDIIDARAQVAADGTDPRTLIALGNAYLRRSWIPEALDAYERAADFDPDSAVAWNNAGILYERLGRFDKARGAFQRAVKNDPKNADAHYNLAVTYERERSFDRAVSHYREALFLRPELGDPILNPRSNQSRFLLPVRLSIYLETVGGQSLPPEGMKGDVIGILGPAAAAPPGDAPAPTPSPTVPPILVPRPAHSEVPPPPPVATPSPSAEARPGGGPRGAAPGAASAGAGNPAARPPGAGGERPLVPGMPKPQNPNEGRGQAPPPSAADAEATGAETPAPTPAGPENAPAN